jgi:RNA polymerase sigma factor for flagellar operon FliA
MEKRRFGDVFMQRAVQKKKEKSLEAGRPGGVAAPEDPNTGLVVEFAQTIRYMAQRMAFRLPPALDVDDLIHAGIIGLMDAASKYDPTKEVRFRTYAEFRIRGAMLDEIRNLDWVPRSVHEKKTALERAYAKLQQEFGRAATDEEVAREMGVSLSELIVILDEAKSVSLVSLDDVGVQEGEERALINSIADSNAENPLLSLLACDVRDQLMVAIRALPDREYRVMTLYYYDELTMKEIGLVLGLTESRICQIHTQAILRLKGQMAAKRGV